MFLASLSPNSSTLIDGDVTRCPICRGAVSLDDMPAHIGKEILQLNHVTFTQADLDPKRRILSGARMTSSPRGGPVHSNTRYQVLQHITL